jgi:transcriptional regulator with XRE-family HTH domain
MGNASNTGCMVATIRGLRGLTQKDLARMSGLPHPYICRLERGQKTFNEAQLHKLELALGVSFAAIRPAFEAFAIVASGNGHAAPADADAA